MTIIRYNRSPYNRPGGTFYPTRLQLVSSFSRCAQSELDSTFKVVNEGLQVLNSRYETFVSSTITDSHKLLYLPSSITSSFNVTQPRSTIISNQAICQAIQLKSSFNVPWVSSPLYSSYFTIVGSTLQSSLNLNIAFSKLYSSFQELIKSEIKSSVDICLPRSILNSSYSYEMFPSVFWGAMELRNAEVLDLIDCGPQPSGNTFQNGAKNVSVKRQENFTVSLAYYTEDLNEIKSLKDMIGSYQNLNLYRYPIPDCTITALKYERVSPEFSEPLYYLEVTYEQDNFLRRGLDLPIARVKYGDVEFTYAEVTDSITVTKQTQRVTTQDGQTGIFNPPIRSKVFTLSCYTRDLNEVKSVENMGDTVQDLLLFGETTKNCKITAFKYVLVDVYADNRYYKYDLTIEEDTLLRQMSVTNNQFSFNGNLITFAQVTDMIDLGLQAMKLTSSLGGSIVRTPFILGNIIKLDCYTRDLSQVMAFKAHIGINAPLVTPDQTFENCQITDFKYQKLGQYVGDPVWNFTLTLEQSSILPLIGNQSPGVIWNGLKFGFAELETEIDFNLDSNKSKSYLGKSGTVASSSPSQAVSFICYTKSKDEIDWLANNLGTYGNLDLYGISLPDKYTITEFRWKPLAPYGSDKLYAYNIVLTQDQLH